MTYPSTMQGKKILITGAAGFIGSHLATELAAENEIIAIDDGSFGIVANVPADADFREQSILDEHLPTDVELIYHFADISQCTVHEHDRRRGVAISVEGFVNVVEQALRDGCDTVVYPSTSSLYSQDGEPVTEIAETKPTTALQAAAASRESYGEYFAAHFDLNVAGIRLFPVYRGYRERTDHDLKYPNPVAEFVDCVAHGRPPTIYGDGTQKRDLSHIDDVVRALIGVGNQQLTGIYNLGSGRAVSLNQLISMIASELDVDVEPQYIANSVPRMLSHPGSIAHNSKIHKATDWVPKISLEEGIERICRNYEVTDA